MDALKGIKGWFDVLRFDKGMFSGVFGDSFSFIPKEWFVVLIAVGVLFYLILKYWQDSPMVRMDA